MLTASTEAWLALIPKRIFSKVAISMRADKRLKTRSQTFKVFPRNICQDSFLESKLTTCQGLSPADDHACIQLYFYRRSHIPKPSPKYHCTTSAFLTPVLLLLGNDMASCKFHLTTAVTPLEDCLGNSKQSSFRCRAYSCGMNFVLPRLYCYQYKQ